MMWWWLLAMLVVPLAIVGAFVVVVALAELLRRRSIRQVRDAWQRERNVDFMVALAEGVAGRGFVTWPGPGDAMLVSLDGWTSQREERIYAGIRAAGVPYDIAVVIVPGDPS